jgi:hypothetical protein
MKTLSWKLDPSGTLRAALASQRLGRAIVVEALGTESTPPAMRRRVPLDASVTLAEVNARRPGGK